jgi:hypothetical protein
MRMVRLGILRFLTDRSSLWWFQVSVLSVALGDGDVAVAKELLNLADIAARLPIKSTCRPVRSTIAIYYRGNHG